MSDSISPEIRLLQDMNQTINERYEIKSKYNALEGELKALEAEEAERKVNYDRLRRKELVELEHIGRELCQQHSKVLHQIEHIGWHLSNAHPHEIGTPIELPQLPAKVCHGDGAVSGHGHGHSHAAHGKHHCSHKSGSNMVNCGARCAV